MVQHGSLTCRPATYCSCVATSGTCADAGQEAVCRDAVCAVVRCCVRQFERHTRHWCPHEAPASEIYATAQSVAEAADTRTPGACHSVARSTAVHSTAAHHKQAVCAQSSQARCITLATVASSLERSQQWLDGSQQPQTKPPSILERVCQNNQHSTTQTGGDATARRPTEYKIDHSTRNLHASTPSELLITHQKSATKHYLRCTK